jgi:putative adenylate-forming enzyme
VIGLSNLAGVLYWYARTRRLRLTDRAALEAHQARAWRRYAQRVLRRNPYFAPWVGQPLDQWPTMDKALMMRHFDRMNTAGLRLADVLACAREAERSRDFTPRVGRFSVGLSSGTSGGRGVFVVSPREQAQWAGVMLARLLPDGLLGRKERVGLFLRADNNLYHAVRTPWLSFAFFDLFQPLHAHFEALARLRPTIVVAPAQVLRALALARRAGQLDLQPARVISIAEVLEPQDRALLSETFGRVDEVYQATEGFLASSCAQGTLHLNEEFLLIEPQWLDDDRFVPLITDFSRRTQPIVRYRLDDVLVRRREPCGCGRAAMALARIEGRCDDMLILPGQMGPSEGEARTVTIFADVVHRALAQALPTAADYRLTQHGAATLALWTDGPD